MTNLNRRISIEQAFHCDYVVFEAMYKLNQRRAHREKIKFYLLMFNLRNEPQVHHFTKHRDRFNEIILNNLRSTDIFTEFKPGQFLALVNCSDINGAHIASQRIISIFRRKATSGIRVNYYVEELSGTKGIEELQFED